MVIQISARRVKHPIVHFDKRSLLLYFKGWTHFTGSPAPDPNPQWDSLSGEVQSIGHGVLLGGTLSNLSATVPFQHEGRVDMSTILLTR